MQRAFARVQRTISETPQQFQQKFGNLPCGTIANSAAYLPMSFVTRRATSSRSKASPNSEAEGPAIPGPLGAADVRRYIQHLHDTDCLFLMVKETFEIAEDVMIGISNDDVPRLVRFHRDRGQDLMADMLDHVLLVGDGRSTFMTSVPQNNEVINHILLYARRRDGLYDIVVAKGKQKKELDWDAIGKSTAGSVAVGAVAGIMTFAVPPAAPAAAAVAASTAGVLVCGTAAKTCWDYNTPLQDVVNGFLLQSLIDKRLIEVTDAGVQIRATLRE